MTSNYFDYSTKWARSVRAHFCLFLLALSPLLVLGSSPESADTTHRLEVQSFYMFTGGSVKAQALELALGTETRYGIGLSWAFNNHFKPVQYIYTFLHNGYSDNVIQRFGIHGFAERPFKRYSFKNGGFSLRGQAYLAHRPIGTGNYDPITFVPDGLPYTRDELWVRYRGPNRLDDGSTENGFAIEFNTFLKMTYVLHENISLIQGYGFGWGYYPGFERTILIAARPMELLRNAYFMGLSYSLDTRHSDVEVSNFTYPISRHSVSIGHAISAITSTVNFSYHFYSQRHEIHAGLLYSPWKMPTFENQVFYDRGFARNQKERFGLELGYAFHLLKKAPIDPYLFMQVQVKKMGLWVDYFAAEPGMSVPPDTLFNRWDTTVYRWFRYQSPNPVVSIETAGGVGLSLQLGERLFLDQRLGIGLGYYIHEFEEYFPGPKKNTEFIWPFFKVGIGYRLGPRNSSGN